MGFKRHLTDAEKLRAIELLRAMKPTSEVLRMYTAPALQIPRPKRVRHGSR